jgi:hypothetical protein
MSFDQEWSLSDAAADRAQPGLTAAEKAARLRAVQAALAQHGASDTQPADAPIAATSSTTQTSEPVRVPAAPIDIPKLEKTVMHPIKTALYLDFDNVFLGLRRESNAGALAFASNPSAWLAWFERGGHQALTEPDATPNPRRFLVRRCYANPKLFWPYREAFVRAGFSVSDCPALTRMGKNSADMYMALDIYDALKHDTPRDEFIILSSDADFTPILTRLREHDRRSTIITNAVSAAALRAAADYAVTDTAFIRETLGIEPDDQLCATVGSAIYKALTESSDGTILLSSLGEQPLIKDVKDRLVKSKYCGHGSLLALLKSSEVPGRFMLSITGTRVLIYDPERWAEPTEPANSDQPDCSGPDAICAAAE